MGRNLLFCLLLSILSAYPMASQAAGCVTNFKVTDVNGMATPHYLSDQVQFSALTCQDLRAYQLGLKAFSYSYGLIGSGLALMCTGAGATVGVVMFGIGATIGAADLILDSLDCVDKTKEEQDELVRTEVCRVLSAQGIECKPDALVRK